MAEKTALDWTAFSLLVAGGLNWGLVGLVNLNLVQTLLGSVPTVEKAVYVLVGLSAAYGLYYVTSKR